MPELNTEEEQHQFKHLSCRHGSDKYWFRASCSNKLHVHLRALHSVNEPGSTALRCRICSRTLRKKPSQHEQRLYMLLGRLQLAFATEVMLFPSIFDDSKNGFKVSRHPVDVVLAGSCLLIEVDGSQHFSVDYQKQGWEEQAERDGVIDSTCLHLNYCCVRLHYQDSDDAWEGAIKQAIEQSQGSPAGFVHYSAKYNKAPLS